jgi:hypothetical protein
MSTFTIGEEVMYDGKRYVISELRPALSARTGPYQVRLLQTTSSGARMPWVELSKLHKIDRYTRAHDDTLQLP